MLFCGWNYVIKNFGRCNCNVDDTKSQDKQNKKANDEMNICCILTL